VFRSLVRPGFELEGHRGKLDSVVSMSFAFQRMGALIAPSRGWLRSWAPIRLGERTAPRRLPFGVRLFLCHVLAVGCLLLLGAGSAWARGLSGSEVPAPMCDPDGASVAAGEEIPEIDHGRFEALPCEAQLLLAGWRLDAPELGSRATRCDGTDSSAPSTPAPPQARYEGACELGAPFPGRVEPMPAAFSQREGLEPRRGHARALFRPPAVLA
jgi:hypothetical protein